MVDESLVCWLCGTSVMQNRHGDWLHIDEIPKQFDPHDVMGPVPGLEFRARVDQRSNLKEAATDMLVHHSQLHPSSDCEWARKLAAAIRA